MAGMLLIPLMIPVAYAASNAGSYIEGKGVRLIGGVLDVGLMAASTYVVSSEYDVYRKMRPEEKDIGGSIPLTVSLFVANYVAMKRLIGSPTSLYTDAAVAGDVAGLPFVVIGSAMLLDH